MANVIDAPVSPSPAHGSIVRLTLLGGFLAEIEDRDGRREIRVTARKARALLGYLAAAPRQRAGREKLASLLWGDRVDSQARQSLRQCLVVLRQDLAPADPFDVDSDEIALKPDVLTADVVEFAAAAQSSDIGTLERACAAYRGEFLADLSTGMEPFEEWLRGERARFEGLAAHAFAQASAAWNANDDARAVDAALRLVALDPLREDWQRSLLRMLARHRGREAALAQADIFAELLWRELEVSPSAETNALLDEIRSGRDAPRHPAPAEVGGVFAPSLGTPMRPAVAAMSAGSSQVATTPAFGRRLAGPTGSPMTIAAVTAAIAATTGAALLVDHYVAARTAPARSASTEIAVNSPRPASVLKGVRADAGPLGQYALVVLPFSTDTPSGSPESRIAAEMTDDLINDLSRTPTARVISRQTSRLYGDRAMDVAAIGAELGVRYVIEGSVRRQHDLLRVNVALTDTRSRVQIWSDRFERHDTERFEIQDEMMRGLARRLHLTLMDVNASSARSRSSDPAIGELAAKGWSGIFRSSVVGHTGDAEMLFTSLLARQPGLVPALVGLAAHNLVLLANLMVADSEERLARADALLRKALSRNPRSSVAHYFAGILHKHRGDQEAAHAAFMRTLELNPSHAPAYAHLGHTLMLLGRADEALDHIRYAIRLSPKDPTLGYWYVMAGEVELELGHDAAARDWLRQAVQVSPGNPRMHVFLAALCAVQDDMNCAVRHASEARRLTPALAIEKLASTFAARTRGKAGHLLLGGLRRAFPAT